MRDQENKVKKLTTIIIIIYFATVLGLSIIFGWAFIQLMELLGIV